MKTWSTKLSFVTWIIVCSLFIASALAYAESAKKPSSYSPVVITEPFDSIMTRMEAAKPEIMKRQMDLLNSRYDLNNNPSKSISMSRGKPIQEGVRVKLPQGVTWEMLANLTPEEIREKDIFPAGFFPLPHPNHPEGGMLFPKKFHRGNQETGRQGFNSFRPGFRHSRATSYRN